MAFTMLTATVGTGFRDSGARARRDYTAALRGRLAALRGA